MGSDVQGTGNCPWIRNYCASIITGGNIWSISSIDGEYENETFRKGLIKSALNRLLFPVF